MFDSGKSHPSLRLSINLLITLGVTVSSSLLLYCQETLARSLFVLPKQQDHPLDGATDRAGGGGGEDNCA